MTNSTALRVLIVSGALALGMSACRPADPADVPAEAMAEGPLSYEAATPYAKVSLTLPEAIRSFPDLYADLYQREVGSLKDYAEGAQADRSEFGGGDFPPYEKAIDYSAPVETGRLFSMIRSDFDHSGGAHPNTVASSLLWDKATNTALSADDLFAKDADRAAIERTLCDAVTAAKKNRPGSVPLAATGTWSCPQLKGVSVALAASNAAEKASGLIFLLDAYAVGPYVEGAYYLSVPFSTLGAAINPAYANDFGGTGTVGDVTNALQPQ